MARIGRLPPGQTQRSCRSLSLSLSNLLSIFSLLQSCNLGAVPSKAVLSSASNPNNDAIANALVTAANDPSWLQEAIAIDDVENVIFSEGTEAVLRVDIPYEQFFNSMTQAAFEKVRELEGPEP